MTEKTLDWLNHNRERAYPFVNDEGLIYHGKRFPNCVLLDCLVVDTRHIDHIPELIFTKVTVTADETQIEFSYDGTSHSYTLTRGNENLSDNTVVKVEGSFLPDIGDEYLYIKFVLSSHDYILQKVGIGEWRINGKVLPTKVLSSTASGVSGIRVKGSKNVDGFNNERVAYGDVHLVDGYRTQPVIQNGKVIVKVGTHYGEDPCHYNNETDSIKTNCDDLLLFFCGQNAINSGNITLQGGPGVSIKQGNMYTAKSDIVDTYGEIGIHQGEKIPCIEVVASSELLRIYRPTENIQD